MSEYLESEFEKIDNAIENYFTSYVTGASKYKKFLYSNLPAPITMFFYYIYKAFRDF